MPWDKERWKDFMRVDLQATSIYDRWYKYARTGRHGLFSVVIV